MQLNGILLSKKKKFDIFYFFKSFVSVLIDLINVRKSDIKY